MSVEDESAISSVEAAVLADQEAIIAQGLKTFYAVGTALVTIRDQRLYRQEHNTFEVYCQERWGLKQSRAYQFIDAAGVVSDLQSSTIVELPQNEAQARPLAALPSEQRAVAWQEAVQTAPDGKVTGAHVTATVRNIQGSRPAAQQEAPDPWDEPDADPDAGLYSRPEPPAPEWPREHVATTYDAAPPSPPVDLSRERARQEQATSDAYIKATKDAATECAEDRAVFFRAVRIIKEQVRGSAPEKAIASLQPGDDQQAHWFLDDVEEWCRELRAGLPRRLRSVSGERG